jgi:hypothetical protein
MSVPLSQAARDRLRAQVRRERELAARVLAAEGRLADAIARRDAVLAAQDGIIAARRDDVADALISYVDEAGVGVERAAIILGRSRGELSRTVRERRLAIKAN